jgi:hypothetical protein
MFEKPLQMDDFEMSIYDTFKQFGASRRDFTNKLLSLIPEIDRLKIWKKAGFNSIFDYCLKIAGLSVRLVKQSLSVNRKLAQIPELTALIETQGLSKIDIISRIAKVETKDFWLDKVKNMTRDSLKMLVCEEKAYQMATGKPLLGTSQTINTLKVHKMVNDFGLNKMKIELSDKAQQAFLKLKQDYPNLCNRDALEMMLRSLIKSKNNGRTFAKKKKIFQNKITRHIPSYIKSKLPDKCSYCSCNKPATCVYRPYRFSEVPNHKALKPLCKEHHEFLHNGIIQNEADLSEKWIFNGKLKLADLSYRKHRRK